MKVTLQDGRQMVGQMLAFDKVSVAKTQCVKESNLLAAYEPGARRH
jgi:hypothetical protein